MKAVEQRGMVGVRHEESSFCGKNLLSLHLANREDYKNRTKYKMQDQNPVNE